MDFGVPESLAHYSFTILLFLGVKVILRRMVGSLAAKEESKVDLEWNGEGEGV